MILVCGIPSEAPVHLITQAADKLGIECILFNQRESHLNDICLEIDKGCIGGIINISGNDWELNAFSGVYLRLMDHTLLPENKVGADADNDKVLKSSLLHQLLNEWAEITDIRVMNRNGNMSSNMSKPYQARLITQCGFKTPATLITNDPEQAIAFRKTQGRVVFKSISSERSIVKELTGVKLSDIKKIRNLPTQFQAFVPGVNIRVHVAGSEVFASRIETEAIDYRYAGMENCAMEMSAWELRADIKAKCFRLSQSLGLPLCGIDLKRTPEDEYYCFEVNPSPGYSYYEEKTGQKISYAIVKYLERIQ